MAESKETNYEQLTFGGFVALLNKTKDSNSNCTPLPEDFFSKLVPLSDERHIAVSITYGTICVVGLIANFVLLFLLLTGGRRGATFKAPSTILIMNLAIADTLFLLTLPFAISQRLERGWKFGSVMCKFEEGVKFLNYYGSIFFITAMAVDRYLVLTNPAASNRRKARRYMCIVSFILWAVGLVFVLPLLIFASVDDYGFCRIMFPGHSTFTVHNASNAMQAMVEEECLENYLYYSESEEYYDDFVKKMEEDLSDDVPYVAGSGSVEDYSDYFEASHAYFDERFVCQHPEIPSLHAWLIWNFFIGFVIPFFIIAWCYIRIMKLRIPLTSLTRERHTADADSTNNNIVRYNRVEHTSIPRDDANKLISDSQTLKQSSTNQRAKILMNILVPCLIAAFCICWLPYHVLHLLQIRGVKFGDSKTCYVFRDVTFCLAFFNSALNPILNSLFLFNFKQLRRSSNWVTGKLKNLNLRKKENNGSGNGALANGGKNTCYDETTAAEMTVMTSVVGLEDE